jgi:hypothetical protein
MAAAAAEVRMRALEKYVALYIKEFPTSGISIRDWFDKFRNIPARYQVTAQEKIELALPLLPPRASRFWTDAPPALPHINPANDAEQQANWNFFVVHITDFLVDPTKRASCYDELQKLHQGSGTVSEYLDKFQDLFRSTSWYAPYMQGLDVVRKQIHRLFAQGLDRDLILVVGNLDNYRSLQEIATAASSMESTLKEKNRRDQGDATLQMLLREIEALKTKASETGQFVQHMQGNHYGSPTRNHFGSPTRQGPPQFPVPQEQMAPAVGYMPQQGYPSQSPVQEQYNPLRQYAPYPLPVVSPPVGYGAQPPMGPLYSSIPPAVQQAYGYHYPTAPQAAKCYRCGAWGHSSAGCRIPRQVECNYCHKPGHIARACKTKSYHRRNPQHVPPQEEKKQMVQQPIEEEDDKSQDNESLYPGLINGKPVSIFIDGGSQVSTVSKSYLDRHHAGVPVEPRTNFIHGVGGKLATLGEVKLDMQLSNLKAPIQFQRLDTNLYSVLIGKDVLRKYGGVEDHGSGNIIFCKFPVYLSQGSQFPKTRQELQLFLQNFEVLDLRAQAFGWICKHCKVHSSMLFYLKEISPTDWHLTISGVMLKAALPVNQDGIK